MVFVAACGLFLLVLSEELLFVVATCLLIVTAALVAELRLYGKQASVVPAPGL